MSGTIPVAVAPPPTRVPRLRAREWRELAVLLGIVTVLTVAGWTLLAAVVVPQQMDIGGRVLGLGLGVTEAARRGPPLAGCQCPDSTCAVPRSCGSRPRGTMLPVDRGREPLGRAGVQSR